MDPYSTLGVSPGASDEEIKKAYRDLVKKYHPDRYTDPAMKNTASEKLKSINAAYDEIQRIRSGKSTGSQGFGGGYGGYGSQGGYGSTGGFRYNTYTSDPRYVGIRQKIQMGDLQGAESQLDAMQERGPEWHYLKGVIALRRGWYAGARQHFTNAHNMAPQNPEYAQAYASLNNMGGGYGNFYGGESRQSDCSVCDICTTLLCAELCCGLGRC